MMKRRHRLTEDEWRLMQADWDNRTPSAVIAKRYSQRLKKRIKPSTIREGARKRGWLGNFHFNEKGV